MSSQAVEQQVAAASCRHVMRQLAGVRAGARGGVISPQELQDLLDGQLPESLRSGTHTVDEIEIEVHAPRGIAERPLQAQIPMGLAGLGWGLRHPAEAWRLFLPVLT